MFKQKTFAITLMLCSACYLSTAAAGDGGVMREAQDRAEIEALMWRYVRALDSFDVDAYAAVFTEDGVFIAGTNAVKGREALKTMIAGYRKDREERAAKGEPASPALYHVDTNTYLEFLGADHARIHYYWMTVFGATGKDTSPRIAAVGRGIDDLVRVNGKWLIKSRDVAPQD